MYRLKTETSEVKVLFCRINQGTEDVYADQISAALGSNYDVDVVTATAAAADMPTLKPHVSTVGDFNPVENYAISGADVVSFAEKIERMVQNEGYDLVIALGLDLIAELIRQDSLRGRVWSVLSESDFLRIDDQHNFTLSLDQVVEESARTVVSGPERQNLVRLAKPRFIHRIITLDDCRAANTFNLAIAQRRVMLYLRPRLNDPSWADRAYEMAESLASSRVHVVVLCHNAQSALGSVFSRDSPHTTVVEPASAAHQLVDDELLPRFAAWHIFVAATDLDCPVVLTDDLEAVEHGFTNSQLKCKLWPIIDFPSYEEYRSAFSSYERIAEAVPRLVYLNDDCRAVVESRIPASTSKGILLANPISPDPVGAKQSNADVFEGYLDRFVADYKAVPLNSTTRKILLAGHDFKFAGELIDVLAQRVDVELRVDHWKAQNLQDEDKSQSLRDWADIILCEFASHNAVWYSWNKKPGQVLVIRFHGYELFSPWIQDINLNNVDKVVFVSNFYMEKVCNQLGWSRDKAVVLPNVVDILDLKRPKKDGARFHLGIAGIVPILKRPDRALDILERLLDLDSRYVLHIRGRAPWDYGWMWENEEIREAYDAFYERISGNPLLRRRIAFDEFSPDMGRWFQNVGWMLSPSYRETFHLAPVEGMASGAIPVVWEREGAVEIFGDEWVHAELDAAIEYITTVNRTADSYSEVSRAASNYAARYDLLINGQQWLKMLFSTCAEHSDVPSTNISIDAMEERFVEKPTTETLTRLFSVLHREGDLARIGELAGGHPQLVVGSALKYVAAQRWAAGVERLKAAPPPVPRRSEGAAYLIEHGSVLFAINEFCEASLQRAWTAPLLESVQDGKVSVVSVTSATVNTAFLDSDHGRETIYVQDLPVTRLPLRNSDDLLLPQFIIAATDAIVREARAVRPAGIAAHSDFWVGLPALLAARRLGVPFMLADSPLTEDDELSLICLEQADAVFAFNGTPIDCLSDATSSYRVATNQDEQINLADLRVGVIADNFTSTTIAHSFHTFPLSRHDGYVEVASLDLDAIFVESAWEGAQNQWRRGVAYYPDEIKDLEKIIKVARARGIPVIFWNKEDPVHFRAFERTARMMDHVFTTDADMVGKYLQSADSANQSVSSLPFYAEPVIHNPLPTERKYMHTVSYAGTYYGDRFKERSEELHRILDAAKVHGLTIYDRQVNVPNSPYHFPAELVPYVREGVPYKEVLEVYKAHPVNINVNSANDSPTMFSRRVVEIAASGSLVLSGRGRGITEQIRGIEATNSDSRWAELLSSWMSDETGRVAAVWRQMRTITRSHLAEHALAIVMRTAGIPVIARALPSYALARKGIESDEVAAILRQTWRPAVVFTDSISAPNREALEEGGISVAPASQIDQVEQSWIASWGNVPTDSYFEDLLHATRFGTYSVLSGRMYSARDGIGNPIIELGRNGEFAELHRVPHGMPIEDSPLTWILPGADFDEC
ncbi:hypothetical protein ACLKOZ_19095 [Arthrobacter sp. R4]|uniref:glycosyltransferase family protein n=1 Tax=Arthrobacter sp. R4 TaxID=644417 RepID=UPI003ED8F11E